MAGDEVGVQMGEKDVFDLEIIFGGEGDVLVDGGLWVDDGGGGGFFVTDEVGGVGEAAEVELLEDHGGDGSGAEAPYFLGHRCRGLNRYPQSDTAVETATHEAMLGRSASRRNHQA